MIMEPICVMRFLIYLALFILIQGEDLDRTPSEHIQTQRDRNDAMAVFKRELIKMAEECNRKHFSDTKMTWLMLHTHSDYRPGKCFLHCMMQQYDMVTEHGELRGDVMRRSAAGIPSEKTRRLVVASVDSCVARAAPARDVCEKAYTLSECLYRNAFQNDN